MGETAIWRRWFLLLPVVLLPLSGCVGDARRAATGPGPAMGPDPAMVVAANPLAARAGRAILRQGGSAVDAAIAVQMVLNLVEPQSSGIGGGAFLMHYDAARRSVTAYDGRETAPAGIHPDVFLGPDGKPREFYDAVVGGISVGVPGVLRMLALAHRQHGRLPWKALFQPAVRLAEDGFAVSPRLNALLARDKYLRRMPAAAAYFYDSAGRPWPVGHRLRNPALAATLRAVARRGVAAFYGGAIARDIVRAVRRARRNPGSLSRADLANYRAKARAPLCRPYRRWVVCGMPPPTSGGIATLQILGLLERFDLAALRPGSVDAVYLISEAERLAFADRARYVADSDFVAVPVTGLLDRGYLARRSRLISRSRSMGRAEPGNPPGSAALRRADGDAAALPSTSHLSIVDSRGNAVSMTTSVENAFGSRIMVRGFLLNNQLTDFSFRPVVDGRPVANRVAPGKRPRSSMSPTLVFARRADGSRGRLVMAVGSPGGSRIIGYVVETVIAVLDWRLGMQAAVALPRFVNRNGATDLEAGTALVAIAPALEARGDEVRFRRMVSGLHGILVRRGADGRPRLEGGADPRREGVALGD